MPAAACPADEVFCEHYCRSVFASPRGNVVPDVIRLEPPASVKEFAAWLAGEVDCEHFDSTTCVTHDDGMGRDRDLAEGMLVDL